MLPPGLEADYGVVRQLPLFEGIPDGDLVHAMAQGGIALRSLERDMFVLDPIGLAGGQPAPVVYVARGQVASAVFTENDLHDRRAAQIAHENASQEEREEESLIKPAPLARIALKNVALFMEGDLFNSGALAATHGQPIAFYTTAPSALVSLDHRWIAELAVRHPVFEQRLRRALSVSRERLAWVSGVKQELLDFFIRQGVSVAGQMVRVRQLDLCIDCKLCEEACEERYGARRLTLGGYQLGMLDFIYTCRTCTDQRCIDPCAYDSIRFDTEKREVVINESTCTGCTACAQACPYGAIDMIEVEPDAPLFKKEFKARLEKRNALQFGAGTPRVARARRIANKCDHCMAYGDQACVSACPTGSLIEVNPYNLFRERSPKMAQLARSGYDGDLTKRDRREVLPVMPFTEGLAVRSGGLAKVKRGRYAPLLTWMLGIFAFLLAFGEVLLRLYAPEMSYEFMKLRASSDYEGQDIKGVIEAVTFRAGDKLSVYVGTLGAALMIVAAIYPIFRRMKLFRWMASNTMWFDFHIMAGTIGPMFVILHSALRLDTWVSAAFWSMIIVVVSGFLGRYLYTQVPALSSGVELEELDHERAFQQARPRLTVPMAEIDRELAIQRSKAQEVAMSPSVSRALWWLIFQDVGRIPNTLARRGRLKQLGVDRSTRNDLARRAARMIVIARRQVVAPKAQLLLHSWKKVHVPFTVILTGFAAVHIWVSWSRAW
ncbi:MAG TPA: 4Fe-4S dicluster domain-containing protein [Kofleriaceae bacterium]|jgi:Fe-S-cluster-containing hydrogenase component 2|nr:4Fe-4S dicluster domain-containing protein [Kofleriaceae bacterium]